MRGQPSAQLWAHLREARVALCDELACLDKIQWAGTLYWRGGRVGPLASGALVQAALKAENANLPSERRMELRFGVNLGVMVEAEQIHS